MVGISAGTFCVGMGVSEELAVLGPKGYLQGESNLNIRHERN